MRLRSYYKSNPEFTSKETNDGTMLLDPSLDDIYLLNETGSFIWREGNGKNSIEDIIKKISQEFDIPRKQASDDTIAFFKNIAKNNPPLFLFSATSDR